MTGFLKKITFLGFLLITNLADPAGLFSQSYHTRNLTIENGLPSNSVQAIFKDSRGYMWIGTEAGLCRYDGTDFRIYTTSDGLPGNRIWSITEDDVGDLWLGCYGNGISRFDGKFFHNYSEIDGLVNDNVRKVKWSDKSKGLFIGTVFGFSYLKNSAFISFKDTTVTDRNLLQVTDFLDCDSIVYLLTYYDTKRFIEFKPYLKQFRYLPKEHRYHIGSHFSTRSFITSKNDTMLANWVNGIKIFSGKGVRYIENLAQVFDMTEDKEGNIWIASWNDGSLADMKGKGGIYKINDYKTEYFSEKLGIKTQKCWCLYYDKNESLLWIGTLDNGLYLYSFSGVESTGASDFNPDHPVIHDILINNGNDIWMSVGDKLIILGKKNIEYKTGIFQECYKKFIKDNFDYYLEPLGSFDFYRKRIGKGLVKYPNPYLEKGKILYPGSLYRPDLYRDLINRKVTGFEKLYKDNSGDIWVKTNLGIFRIGNGIDLDFLFFVMASDNPFFINGDRSVSVLLQYELFIYNRKSTEWFRLRKNATYSSFCNFFQQKEIFWIYNNTEGVVKYKSEKLQRFDYLRNTIDLSFTSMTADKRNNLIASTNSGQIYFLRTDNDSINLTARFSVRDGIIGNDIKWILVDHSNRLWMLTNRGLNMTDLNKYRENGRWEISFFNNENGFTDLKSTKAVIGPDGNIYSISEDFLTRFDPDHLISSVIKPCKLQIEKIEVNFNEYNWVENRPTVNWSGLPEKELILPFDKNTLTFYLHLLQFGEPSKTTFSYKLEGIQRNWTEFSSDNKAVYTKLKPGKYILKARSRLLSSPENILEMEFRFRINPPWYFTWWSITIIIISVFFFSYLLLRNRFRQIRRNAEVKRKLEVLKLEALKSQMNPHFIFNAFNSIQKYILNQDSKAALNYMSDFAGLIRKTLDNSTKESICLTDEISYLKSYLELEQRRIPNLDYTLDAEDDLDSDGILIPPMLIQPVVENSILHGIRHMRGQGMIRIKFLSSSETGGLKCIVEDNGIGRERSMELYKSQGKSYSSMGSQIIKQRADLYGVKIHITDLYSGGSCSGTLVEFLF